MPRELHTLAVIRRPIVTEKSTTLAGQNQYVFEVAERANKLQVKEAVEQGFSVRVLAVNTLRVRGKRRRRRGGWSVARSWKKAVVTLAEGDRIELFEGV